MFDVRIIEENGESNLPVQKKCIERGNRPYDQRLRRPESNNISQL